MKPFEFDQKYEVRKLDVKDVEEMLNFITKYFLPRNPLFKIFRVQFQHQSDYNHREWCRRVVQDNASFACYESQSGKMVALRVATIHDNDQQLIDSLEVNSGGDETLRRFIRWIHRDLLKTLNANKMMLKELSAVIPDHLGNRLTGHLDRYNNAVAMETGCQYTVAVAASHYSVRLNLKLGSKVLREVRYIDYVDPETCVKPDLDLSTLHTGVLVVYQEIELFPKSKL